MNVHERKFPHPVSDDAKVAGEPDGESRETGRETTAAQRPLILRVLRGVLQLALPLAVIAGSVAGYNYLTATKPEPAKRAKTEPAFSVRTVPVEFGSYQPTLTLYGSAVAGRQVDIRALVSGRVVETSPALREGGLVQQGDTLLSIDPLDYETALAEAKAQLAETRARVAEFKASRVADKASLDYAQKQLVLAESDLKRALPLARDGTVSARTVDDRQQVVLQRKQAADQLANAINVWDARIEQQEAIADRMATVIRRTEQRVGDTGLVAPFNAYVTEVGAQIGRMVGVNDKVATLIDRDWIEARFTLTDEQYGRIIAKEGSLEGRDVDVAWKLGQTSFRYPATIERVGAQIQTSSGGVEIFARIKDPSKPTPLRPGAFLSVTLPDTNFEDVARLPATALYNGDTVFVVNADNRLETRKVDVVAGADADLLVRGKLKTGEKVLTSRISTPGDGVLVNQVEKQ